MADRRIRILLAATGLVAVGMGCSSPAESESSAVAVETIPVVVGETIQVSEAPAHPVVVESRDLCDAAFSSSVATDALPLAAPVRWMHRLGYEDQQWDQHDTESHGRGRWIGPEPGSLACISASRQPVDSYRGGGTAFRRVWTVRLVPWGDGSVFLERVFIGGAPPPAFVCFAADPELCDAYGSSPVEALEDWLDHLMGEASS